MDGNHIKHTVIERVHKIADEVDWLHLTIPQRKQLYESWTSDPEIGGLLEQVMDANRVRVYLKDTVMKTYSRSQRLEILTLLDRIGVTFGSVTREFIKPQAVLCDRCDLYTISVAKEWKNSVMSAYERGYEVGTLKTNSVYLTEHTSGRYVDRSYRKMIGTAATRLDVKVHWVT